MPFLYDIGVSIYHAGVALAAPFNTKARKWRDGRVGLFKSIESDLDKIHGAIWVHCSSYGEYEQGKPIIDGLKTSYPEKPIVLTFYSPSGYEVVQSKEKDLFVYYLPKDGSKNARRFLDLIHPTFAVFVKYEFWFHYLNELSVRSIPTFLVSAIFRKEQSFFKWYGKDFRKMLLCFDRIFVQDEESRKLLETIDVTNVEISGDTRFDRVWQIREQNDRSEILEAFAENATNVLVAGSTWPHDEELIIEYFNSNSKKFKLILAPHEVHFEHINELINKLSEAPILYSKAVMSEVAAAKVLVIDSIGILSRTYRYGTLAYIGGGFGKGIHNTLEAAAFGLPVLFGPNHQRFKEARDLISRNAAFAVSGYAQFKATMDDLLQNDVELNKASIAAEHYVKKHQGATSKFLDRVGKVLR